MVLCNPTVFPTIQLWKQNYVLCIWKYFTVFRSPVWCTHMYVTDIHSLVFWNLKKCSSRQYSTKSKDYCSRALMLHPSLMPIQQPYNSTQSYLHLDYTTTHLEVYYITQSPRNIHSTFQRHFQFVSTFEWVCNPIVQSCWHTEYMVTNKLFFVGA